jgi:hypothetical protein
MPGQEMFSMPIAPMLPTGVADFTEEERFGREWRALGFSVSGHPIAIYEI